MKRYSDVYPGDKYLGDDGPGSIYPGGVGSDGMYPGGVGPGGVHPADVGPEGMYPGGGVGPEGMYPGGGVGPEGSFARFYRDYKRPTMVKRPGTMPGSWNFARLYRYSSKGQSLAESEFPSNRSRNEYSEQPESGRSSI